MATISERTVQMKKNFIKHHSNGYVIAQIAEMYSLDVSTVYKHLQEIADENNMNREDLMSKEMYNRKKQKLDANSHEESVAKMINGIDHKFDLIENSIKSIISDIETVLAED